MRRSDVPLRPFAGIPSGAIPSLFFPAYLQHLTSVFSSTSALSSATGRFHPLCHHLRTLFITTEGVGVSFLSQPSNPPTCNAQTFLCLPVTLFALPFFSTTYELPNLQFLCFDNDPTAPGWRDPISTPSSLPYILPSSVCSKSFVSHSYENCRGCTLFLPKMERTSGRQSGGWRSRKVSGR